MREGRDAERAVDGTYVVVDIWRRPHLPHFQARLPPPSALARVIPSKCLPHSHYISSELQLRSSVECQTTRKVIVKVQVTRTFLFSQERVVRFGIRTLGLRFLLVSGCDCDLAPPSTSTFDFPLIFMVFFQFVSRNLTQFSHSRRIHEVAAMIIPIDGRDARAAAPRRRPRLTHLCGSDCARAPMQPQTTASGWRR